MSHSSIDATHIDHINIHVCFLVAMWLSGLTELCIAVEDVKGLTHEIATQNPQHRRQLDPCAH